MFNVIINQQELIRSVITYTPKRGKIVEIGCGSGYVSFLLSKMGSNVTAIDINREVIKSVQKKNCYCSYVNTILADMLNLSLKDNSFDTAFHQGLLEHFDDETIIEALKEQRRVARVVVFDVPNNKYRLGPYNVGDERLLSIKHWKELISRAGLSAIDIQGRGYTKFAYLLPLFIVRRFKAYFTSSTIFVCKRSR